MPNGYKTSWLGDTYGQGGPSSATGQYWMQDYISQMVVQSDGTCWTAGPWDEGGRTNGMYKDGLVTGNQDHGINNQSVSVGGHTWTINGSSVTSDDGRSLPSPGVPAALGVTSDGQLLVADNSSRKQILFYNVSGTPVLSGTFGAVGGIGASYTSSYAIPAATNSPAYPAGTYGPGVYHPLKLWSMTGVGEDSSGRLFVSRANIGGGSAILCFKKDTSGNWVLNWRIESYCFVDNVDFDASTDGVDVYGVQEHYKMDYGQTNVGSEWSIYGYTADSQAFPNDPRNIDQVHAGQEHGLTSCWYRNVNGHRLLFVEGMTTQMMNIFRFESGSERAIPTGLVMEAGHTIYGTPNGLFWPPNRPASSNSTIIWNDLNDNGDYQANEYSTAPYGYTYGQWIDRGGNIWWGGNPLVEAKITSFDSSGNPTYASSGVQSYSINGMPSVGNIQYEEDKDRMVLCDKAGEGLTGGSIYKIDGWSAGNRTATKVYTMSSNQPTGFSAAGDYVFEVGYASRGEVWAHSLIDGSLTGTMDVPASLGGNGYSGNVDIGYGIHAFKRSTGEYEIAVEDDYMAKVLLYRWNPGGVSTAATPAFSPVGGSYSTAQSVTISDATSGAVIHYTTDGSTPTASSATYSSPISVSSTKTIKAIATANGFSNSPVASATYTFPANTPDLIVTAITMSPASPATGNAVTFTATVKNQGTGSTPAGTVLGVGFSLDSLGTIVWEDQDTASLAAGASRTETVTGGSSGATWTATSGSHTITAVVDDVNRIAESNETNNSFSQTFTVAASTIPATPTNLKAAAGNAQASLTWTASSGATSYNIYRGTTAGGESATAIATGITGTSYTNTGLTNGSVYYYEVKAVNSAGSSGYSNEDLAEPGTQPDLIVTALTWSPASPASGSAVTFTATVRNIGGASTTAGTIIGVGYSVSGIGTVTWEDQDSAALAPGASRAEAATGGSSGSTWTANSGTKTITAYVDDVNRIAELNEGNNTLAKTLTVP